MEDEEVAKAPSPTPTEREKGNAAFKRKDFDASIKFYTQALKDDDCGEKHVLYANRSASYLLSKKPKLAAEDAKRSIETSARYVKGYYRLARAQEALGDLNAAIDSTLKGISTDKGLYGDQNNRKQYATLRKLRKKLLGKLKYESISDYMFEDSADAKKPSTKVWIPLSGVGSIPRGDVSCTFEKRALDVKIRNLNGINYRLLVPELWGDVDPEKCNAVVKKDKIILKICKANMEQRQWDKLGYS